jgi:hypothetical protein
MVILNIFVLIIMVLAFFELVCIKYYFGFPVFDEQFASIVENICYSLIASGIFYILIEMLPSLRKRNYYNKILNTKKLSLNTAYFSIIQFLVGSKVLKNTDNIKEYIIANDYLIKKLDKNQLWDKNIDEIIKRSKNLKEKIDDILKYAEYLDNKIVNALNDVNYHIESINLEYSKYSDPDDKKIYVNLIKDNYQPIIDDYKIIYKFSGKEGILKDFKLSQ